jgi:hypothetical protein
MALTMRIGAALDRPELQPFAASKCPPANPQPASGQFLMLRRKRPCERQLDRIADRIFERAVQFQQREHQQLVRLAVAIQFRAELTSLKEEIEAGIMSLCIR